MYDRCARSDAGADHASFSSADQGSQHHATTGSHGRLFCILTVMARAFELTFLVHIRTISKIRVHQNGVESPLTAVWQRNRVGMQADGGLARDAPWLADLC